VICRGIGLRFSISLHQNNRQTQRYQPDAEDRFDLTHKMEQLRAKLEPVLTRSVPLVVSVFLLQRLQSLKLVAERVRDMHEL
jgi:hypothetical protein